MRTRLLCDRLPQGSGALAAQFDAALDRLLTSGRLREVYEKWGIWNEEQERLASSARLQDILHESGRQWTFTRYFPLLCEGAVVTVEVTCLSMLLAMAIGLPIALSRLYGPAPLASRWPPGTWSSFVAFRCCCSYTSCTTACRPLRNTRSVVDAAAGTLAGGRTGVRVEYAAYEAEIYRSGFRAIPAGQWEAAASLGMSRLLTFRRIILPQAIRLILPPMTNDLVALFKDTSLVSVIAVVELTKQYQVLAKSSLKYLEIGLATALLYLVMSVPLGYLSRYLEQRWGKGL